MDNPSPKTVVLQGPPGVGKSMMACLTAAHPPVHVCDIDRKIQSAGWAQAALASKQLTYWELAETIEETDMKERVRQLASMSKSMKSPRGWSAFTEYFYSLPNLPEAKAAGTWVVDSATHLNEHLKASIMYTAEKSKYSWDQWNALKVGWIDAFSVMRDLAKEHGKDLIITVHERDKEKAGDRTTGVKYVDTKEGQQRVVVGTQDLQVWASIDGAFGELIGSFVDEYYWLHIKMENGEPVYKCRVRPDGLRNLRTSFLQKTSEHEPDFRKIWK